MHARSNPDSSTVSTFACSVPPEVDVIMARRRVRARCCSSYVAARPALMIERDATVARNDRVGLGCGDRLYSAAVVETFVPRRRRTCSASRSLCMRLPRPLTSLDAGYEPEFAYLECVHELKQIVDLIYTRGLSAMRDAISNTAEYGDLTRGPRIVNEATRAEMRRILGEIRGGAFAREWIAEHRSGGKRFTQLHDADVDTPLEHAGRNVRALMPWLRET